MLKGQKGESNFQMGFFKEVVQDRYHISTIIGGGQKRLNDTMTSVLQEYDKFWRLHFLLAQVLMGKDSPPPPPLSTHTHTHKRI
jgi:hypothetical protein